MRMHRDNNADFLRFVAAATVVASHAYPITGRETSEPLYRFTHGATTLGTLALTVFFILSGHLITQSYLRRRDPVDFAGARARRILPGLVVVVLLTAFIYGSLLTTLPLAEYLSHRGTWRYVGAIALWHMPYQLPGVLTDAPYPGVVNGSLWTLWYEVVCYAAVALLGVLGLLRRWTVTALAGALAVAVTVAPTPGYYLTLGLAFACGATWTFYRDSPDRLRPSLAGVVGAGAVIAVALATSSGIPLAASLAGSYLVLCFVFRPVPALARWAHYTGGDLSYGLYVYAFPVQQLVSHFWPSLTPWQHVAGALPPILACAALSWRFVERPAMERRGAASMIPAQPKREVTDVEARATAS